MKSTSTKRKASGQGAPAFPMQGAPLPVAAERLSYIKTAAYFKAEARGFMPGRELEDWLEAQAEFNKIAGR